MKSPKILYECCSDVFLVASNPSIDYFLNDGGTLVVNGLTYFYLKLRVTFQVGKKLYRPFFYGWGSTASRLQPL